MNRDPLRAALQELVRELAPANITLVVGGGYGLLLRAQHTHQSNFRTRSPNIPPTRATEDIDCFLRRETITNATKMGAIRNALDRLGYNPKVPNFQFERSASSEEASMTVKIDLLAASVEPPLDKMVHVHAMRIRARGFSGLHAYLTPEAFAIEEDHLALDVSDDASGLMVHIPHPFAFLALKIMALHDRIAGEGKYHALDLFTIWSTLTEPEWDAAVRMCEKYSRHEVMGKVHDATQALFGAATAPGVLALKDQGRRQEIEIQTAVAEAFRGDVIELMIGSA